MRHFPIISHHARAAHPATSLDIARAPFPHAAPSIRRARHRELHYRRVYIRHFSASSRDTPQQAYFLEVRQYAAQKVPARCCWSATQASIYFASIRCQLLAALIYFSIGRRQSSYQPRNSAHHSPFQAHSTISSGLRSGDIIREYASAAGQRNESIFSRNRLTCRFSSFQEAHTYAMMAGYFASLHLSAARYAVYPPQHTTAAAKDMPQMPPPSPPTPRRPRFCHARWGHYNEAPRYSTAPPEVIRYRRPSLHARR